MTPETQKQGPKLTTVPMDQELALHMLANAEVIFEQYLLVRAELERMQKDSNLKLPRAELGRVYRKNFSRKNRAASYNYDLACVSALIQKYPNIQSREELENIANLYAQNAETRLEQPVTEIIEPTHRQTEATLQIEKTLQAENPTDNDISNWIVDNLSEPK